MMKDKNYQLQLAIICFLYLWTIIAAKTIKCPEQADLEGYVRWKFPMEDLKNGSIKFKRLGDKEVSMLVRIDNEDASKKDCYNVTLSNLTAGQSSTMMIKLGSPTYKTNFSLRIEHLDTTWRPKNNISIPGVLYIYVKGDIEFELTVAGYSRRFDLYMYISIGLGGLLAVFIIISCLPCLRKKCCPKRTGDNDPIIRSVGDQPNTNAPRVTMPRYSEHYYEEMDENFVPFELKPHQGQNTQFSPSRCPSPDHVSENSFYGTTSQVQPRCPSPDHVSENSFYGTTSQVQPRCPSPDHVSENSFYGTTSQPRCPSPDHVSENSFYGTTMS